MPDHPTEETGETPEPQQPQAPPRDHDAPDDDRNPDGLLKALHAERQAKKAAEDARKKSDKERADVVRRLRDFEEAEEQRKNGELTEVERHKKDRAAEAAARAEAEHRATQAEQALVELRIANAVERAALDMGFEYPDIAPSLVNRKLIEYDPDVDEVTGVKDALDKLVKKKPGLLKAKPGGGTPPREGPRPRPGDRPAGPPAKQEPDLEAELRSLGGYV